jgi:hypothetical protein
MLLHAFEYFVRLNYVGVRFDVAVGFVYLLVSLDKEVAFDLYYLFQNPMGIKNL